MPNLSLVVISFNEEKNIERCISSCNGVVDEVIIFDSYSSDKTIDICYKLGAKVIQHKFDGYITQKNRAVQSAKNDWILSLDADESLSEKLKEDILNIKDNLKEGYAYQFNRRNYYCGKSIKHSGWYPDSRIRLFNRKEAKWDGSTPHELVHIESHVKKEVLTSDILHQAYDSIDEHKKKSKQYALMAALELSHKSKAYLINKLIFSPSFRFLKHYLLRLGFLDGWRGLTISRIIFSEVYLKYKTALKLNRK